MKYGLCIVFVALCMPFWAQSSADVLIKKQFYRADKRAIVEFYKTNNNTYAAKTMWLKYPTDKHGNVRTDKKNPQTNLQNRTIVGLDVMYDLKYDKGVWSGTAYHPDHGMTCKVDIALTKEGNLKLKGTKWGISKSEIWQKVEDVDYIKH
ncbi:MAG: DUF2147 domain-containing protein [Bacteroidales bacterium]|nr:DUF2147 domain-containing protein [Bacteroidales bacterium]